MFYVLRGIRRAHSLISVRPRKQPISFTHLALLFDIVQVQYSNYDASMLLSAMSLAFFGMFRVSEYTSAYSESFVPENTLLMEDVYLSGQTLHIHVKISKTDPFRMGSVVRLVQIRSRFCPVRAFVRFVSFRGTSSGPLFLFENGSFLTRRKLSAVLHRIFPTANIDTHSFRIGGASAAASAGIPDSSIQILGRWSSNAFHRYLHYSDADIVRFLSRMSSGY